MAHERARRLTAEDRKRQLIGIGLELLTSTPIDELSIDTVAERAGISRSLLFHHFPSKRDYYAAVVRAACRRVLRAVDEGAAAGEPLEGMIDGLVAFIERRREPYVAFVRGAAGGDAWAQEIFEDTRRALVERALAATGTPDTPAHRLAVRGWLAYTEEVVLDWTLTPVIDRASLVTMCASALDALLGITPRG